MPANVGEMFYYGETPWHGRGIEVPKPITMEEALKSGGLDWEVGEVKLQTCDNPPSPVAKRKAIVRFDRPAGHPGRVLGVVHQDFRPVQNRDGAMLFDGIFGQGKPVYHTGGYLGNGEVVWLMSKIDRTIEVASGDVVEPYALFANSHDGSQALSISLTTIRVVCQNTLNLALRQRDLGAQFRRSHGSSIRQHVEAAEEFFAAMLGELNDAATVFKELASRPCDDKQFDTVLTRLFPNPKKPLSAERNPAVLKGYETRLADAIEARSTVAKLRCEGKGADLPSAEGTAWGALNAIIEYVDHHQKTQLDRLSYALLGDGKNLKMRAFQIVRGIAQSA